MEVEEVEMLEECAEAKEKKDVEMNNDLDVIEMLEECPEN